MVKIFDFLCDCLDLMGKPFRWNYYKASVYVCIHLWPLLCVAMSLVMLGLAVSTTSPLWMAVCAVYAMFNVFGYWMVLRHYYPGTIYEVFDTCVYDLQALAKEWHTTYAVVNLVIYVLLFAAIMAFDVMLILLML